VLTLPFKFNEIDENMSSISIKWDDTDILNENSERIQRDAIDYACMFGMMLPFPTEIGEKFRILVGYFPEGYISKLLSEASPGLDKLWCATNSGC